jgi:cell division septation protein DedD
MKKLSIMLITILSCMVASGQDKDVIVEEKASEWLKVVATAPAVPVRTSTPRTTNTRTSPSVNTRRAATTTTSPRPQPAKQSEFEKTNSKVGRFPKKKD